MPTQFDDDFNEAAMFAPAALSTNPLAKYFRIPGCHVTLPSAGAFLPPGAIELTMSGEVAVLPMKAADELLLKSPDALMSGYAIEKLLESCVPGLRTPRLISQPDLDVLLLAIRAATFGETMSLSAECPKCKEPNDFECNLPALLATAGKIPKENAVKLSNEVVAYVRPYNLHNATRIALASYEEARRLQALDMAEAKEDNVLRAREVNRSLERINLLTLEVLADCVLLIRVPGNEVRDPVAIREFIHNVKKPWVSKLEKKVAEVNGMGIQKAITAKCDNEKCGHAWKTEVELDPASFFASASSD